MQNTYVSVNLTQDFTDAQKGNARTNIGAASMNSFESRRNPFMPYIHQIPDAPIAPSMLPSLCLKKLKAALSV